MALTQAQKIAKAQQKQQTQLSSTQATVGKAIKAGVGRPLTQSVPPKPKKKQRGYGQAQEGRGGYSHGGSVASRLSKAGPVGKPN